MLLFRIIKEDHPETPA